jgi:hypothetical protein
MSQLEHAGGSTAGGSTHAPPPGRAPGKTTRTQRLPAKAQPELEMTGYRDLDDGLACDGQEGQTEACFLDERAAMRLENKLQNAALLVVIATITAIANVYLDLRTIHKRTWGPLHEFIFTMITSALIGPIAGAAVAGTARAAVAAAEVGAVRSAWALAGAAAVNPEKIRGALTMVSKSFRTALAHPDQSLPTDKEGFLKFLQDQAPVIAAGLMEGVAANQLKHQEMLDLLARLTDPQIVGRGAIEARVRTLLKQFEANRIGDIGNVMNLHGGLEVAMPIRVTLRKKQYVVLCESYGKKGSALGLNGANMNLEEGVPEMTMESLVYVRIVEDTFHDLVVAEFKAKRQQDLPTIDFNNAAERTRHRWFGDFYKDTKKQHDEQYVDAIHGVGPAVAHSPDAELAEAP